MQLLLRFRKERLGLQGKRSVRSSSRRFSCLDFLPLQGPVCRPLEGWDQGGEEKEPRWWEMPRLQKAGLTRCAAAGIDRLLLVRASKLLE